jgi:hypothetical protein
MTPVLFNLDDLQLERLMAGAALLPAHQRDAFVRSVAGRVADIPNFGLAEIETAIVYTLNAYGIALGNQALPRTQKGKPNALFR